MLKEFGASCFNAGFGRGKFQVLLLHASEEGYHVFDMFGRCPTVNHRVIEVHMALRQAITHEEHHTLKCPGCGGGTLRGYQPLTQARQSTKCGRFTYCDPSQAADCWMAYRRPNTVTKGRTVR